MEILFRESVQGAVSVRQSGQVIGFMAFSLVAFDNTFISRLTLVCVAFMGSLSVI